MKILLYTELASMIEKSGLGKAITHQMKALESVGIPYTLDTSDSYDILHINTYYLKSYLLARKAKRKGKKIVYHAHSTEEDFKNGFILSDRTSPLFKKWITKCYSLGDVIITPTPYSKRILQTYPGLENKKIYDISNGIEIDYFKPDEEAPLDFRGVYGYSKEDKIVVGIGLYIERKGIVDFVELAKRLPQYKFIWFGHSPLSAAGEDVRNAVKTKLDNLKFAGYVERDMIRSALKDADLYLFPTLEETEGIPVVEACAMKQNILIRDIPVFDDWLEDGVNVYKAKTVDEFEDKIKKIINGELPSLKEESYKVALNRDIKKIGEQLKEVYTTLMNE